MAAPKDKKAPSSILILGSGVFSLSTLASLLSNPRYASTTFTVLSPSFHQPHSASVDSTRIIRADYSDPAYSALAAKAQELWRQPPWNTHYDEPGLLLTYHNKGEQANGADYVRKSLSTVTSNASGDLQVYDTPAALTAAMNVSSPSATVNAAGDAGYINRRSGWADAGGALAAMRNRLQSTAAARVRWVDDEATHLLTSSTTSHGAKQRVLGVATAAGATLHADQTLVATGAWTPTLLDLRGIATCTAQCMAYVSLSAAEAAALQRVPVCLDFGAGIFFFPPTRRAAPTAYGHAWEIKIARHAYGYVNPRATRFGRQSVPSGAGQAIPARDCAELLGFLGAAMPFLDVQGSVGRGEREVSTRLCHYLDTASGDFIVSAHPEFEAESLFVMTGGSGHGYKFLPVLGDQIVDVLEGGKDDDETRMWKAKWAWPQKSTTLAGSVEGLVCCEDGSRAGKPGLVLEDQYIDKARL